MMAGNLASGKLTIKELRALQLTTDLWNVMVEDIVGTDTTRNQDLGELAIHIHGIQHMIMAQSAARAHPHLRLLGET